jgi:hypothetical protein
MEMRNILDQKKDLGFYLHSNWIFSSPAEKIGLAIVIGLAVWKIIGFFI